MKFKKFKGRKYEKVNSEGKKPRGGASFQIDSGHVQLIESLQLRFEQVSSFVDVRRSVRVSIVSVVNRVVFPVGWDGYLCKLKHRVMREETERLTDLDGPNSLVRLTSAICEGYRLSSDRFMSYTSLNGITWGRFHSLVTSRADSSCRTCSAILFVLGVQRLALRLVFQLRRLIGLSISFCGRLAS